MHVDQKPVALVQERVALVQKGVAVVQETLGRPSLYPAALSVAGPPGLKAERS